MKSLSGCNRACSCSKLWKGCGVRCISVTPFLLPWINTILEVQDWPCRESFWSWVGNRCKWQLSNVAIISLQVVFGGRPVPPARGCHDSLLRNRLRRHSIWRRRLRPISRVIRIRQSLRPRSAGLPSASRRAVFAWISRNRMIHRYCA